MMQDLRVNSESYWDSRFSDNWQGFDGPRQSRFFARLAVENFPSWLIEQIRQQSLTLADWGCAQGDGTDIWASYLNSEQLTGVDFSVVAIEQATERYPAIRFICEDWLDMGREACDSYDVVFSSNTLEHFHKPYEVLETLGKRAKKALALALPYREMERIDEHFYSFLPDNIPLELHNGFRLVWSRVIDCRYLPNTVWGGDQIFLVYVEAAWVASLKLTLHDCEIGQVDTASEISSLDQVVAERDEQVAGLNQVVAERDEQVASLNQAIAGRDERLASFNQAVTERDGQIASLNQVATERDKQIANLNQAAVYRDSQLVRLRNEADSLFSRLEQLLQSRSWQITRPLRAAVRTFTHGHPFDDGNQAIYDIAARMGRKFPFPLWLKARVRTALIERMYPTVQSSPESKIEASQALLQSLAMHGDLCIRMRPECSSLIEGLVSVVLPVYNQANLIIESIESVLTQTYQKFELIIINDGSTDGIEAVLEHYLDHPQVRCFTQANQRLPKALSNGFSYARGEFWTWTSADNIMEPKMLEMLVDKLQAEPDLGMTYADYYAIDDLGHLLQDKTWRAHNRPNASSGEIRLPQTAEALNSVQDNFIGPCFMYRGWIGRCLGDYYTQLGVEDYDYWMRINAFFPIRHLGNKSLLYRYRVHNNTLSAQAHEHRILTKAQHLMSYEKDRAKFYASSMEYAADSRGLAWLQAVKVSHTDIHPFDVGIGNEVLAVISCDNAEKNLSGLLDSFRPTAIILSQNDTRYHKLFRLFSGGHCIVLAEDRTSAERVRLISSSCPVIDAMSSMAPVAIRAFAKNLLFVRATRNADKMKRIMPHLMLPQRNYHVVLQVDSFTQGGMENVVIDLALSLQTNGYRVAIVNFGKSGDASVKAKELGIQVISLPSDITDDSYRSWLLEAHVDVVNAHYSIRGAAACRGAEIPFIQTVHNSYVWFDPVQIEKYREADRYTSIYLCVSMTAARYADIVLGLDVCKMRVVPNGIDPSAIDAPHFATNRASLRNTWNVGDEAPVFLNVASIMATKAQLPLVKAFARVVEKVPEARLVLLGAVMEAPYQAAIEKAVHELGLQKHVLFAGYDREVARYYHAADVFVLPSYWEGWSLSLGEAMANGLACVITDVGSAYEFEGLSNIKIVEPPFGDITTLNFRNLGNFVYGKDEYFENRLAVAMIKVADFRRASVDTSLVEQFDREIAYRIYAEIFNDTIKESVR